MQKSHEKYIVENKFIEERCYDVLEEMRQCCIKWKSVSLCCEGIDINKPYPLTKKDTENKKN